MLASRFKKHVIRITAVWLTLENLLPNIAFYLFSPGNNIDGTRLLSTFKTDIT